METARMNKANIQDILKSAAPIIGLIVVALAFGIASDWTIFSSRNLKMIVNQNFPTLVVCMGATFYWAWGILDLSVSGVLGCAAVAAGIILRTDAPIWVGILGAIATAVFLDLCIAFVGAFFKLPMFLSTLCFMFVTNGIVQIATLDEVIVITRDCSMFNNVNLKLIISGVVIIVIYLLFDHTFLGKTSKIIGGNEKAAAFSGVKINKVKILSFLIAGICIGIAGFFSAIRIQTIDYTVGSGMQFNAMTALVFGGMPFGGGKHARFYNGLIGTLTYALLTNGLQVVGVDYNVIYLIKGAVFLAVVAISFPRFKSKMLP